MLRSTKARFAFEDDVAWMTTPAQRANSKIRSTKPPRRVLPALCMPGPPLSRPSTRPLEITDQLGGRQDLLADWAGTRLPIEVARRVRGHIGEAHPGGIAPRRFQRSGGWL